ncbi:hypothetical protein NUM3379_15520 [Kineococcus sp. NUM-3379]
MSRGAGEPVGGVVSYPASTVVGPLGAPATPGRSSPPPGTRARTAEGAPMTTAHETHPEDQAQDPTGQVPEGEA